MGLCGSFFDRLRANGACPEVSWRQCGVLVEWETVHMSSDGRCRRLSVMLMRHGQASCNELKKQTAVGPPVF
jgi:hypothetical protein